MGNKKEDTWEKTNYCVYLNSLKLSFTNSTFCTILLSFPCVHPLHRQLILHKTVRLATCLWLSRNEWCIRWPMIFLMVICLIKFFFPEIYKVNTSKYYVLHWIQGAVYCAHLFHISLRKHCPLNMFSHHLFTYIPVLKILKVSFKVYVRVSEACL